MRINESAPRGFNPYNARHRVRVALMNPLAKYLDPSVVQRIERLDLTARFIVEGFLSGLHTSPLHGLSAEFSEHRKYSQGDELRSIDWNVFARTDRLFVRKYQAETHLACQIVLDASASMGPVGLTGDFHAVAPAHRPDAKPATKLDYSVRLAAALAYLVVRQQDSVGLAIVDTQVRSFLPPRSRRVHLLRLIAALSETVPRGSTGLAASVGEVLRRLPHRGLIIVLSDLLTETRQTLEALHHVRFRGHDLIVLHVLDAAEATFPFEGTLKLEDPESGRSLTTSAAEARDRYRRAVADWRGELERGLAASRADYVPLDTSTQFDRALVEFLTRRAQRL